MKSIEELKARREEAIKEIKLRDDSVRYTFELNNKGNSKEILNKLLELIIEGNLDARAYISYRECNCELTVIYDDKAECYKDVTVDNIPLILNSYLINNAPYEALLKD